MTKLEEYRKEIDQIDDQLVQLFEQRMDVAKKIGKYKKEHHLPILNQAREQKIVEKNISYLKNKEYSQIARAFFENIMKLSREYQNYINNS